MVNNGGRGMKKHDIQGISTLVLIVVSVLFILVSGVLLSPYDIKNKELEHTDLSFNDGWVRVFENGEKQDFQIPYEGNIYPNEVIVITKVLPEWFNGEQYFHFVSYSQFVEIRIDDTVVFSDMDNSNVPFGKTPPPGGCYLRISGENAGKTITFTVTSPYGKKGGSVGPFHAGSALKMVHTRLENNAGQILLDIMIFIIGCYFIYYAHHIRLYKADLHKSSLSLGVFAVIFSFYLRFGVSRFPFIYADGFFGSITAVIALSLCPMPFLMFYRVRARGKFIICYDALFWFSAFNLILLMALQITGIADFLDSYVISIAIVAATIVLVFINHAVAFLRQEMYGSALENIGIVVMMVAFGIEFYVYSVIGWSRMGIFSRIGFIAFLFCALFTIVRDYKQRESVRIENEKRLRDLRVDVMISQIRPHFIYNTLASISYLCEHDPALARHTVDDFADFLRGILDSLGEQKIIPIEKELMHLKRYLSIEQTRFGDILKIKYDIRATGFRVPALTIQPLVENAVRYGVTKRDEGGTVEIKTEETKDDYIITITDDGIGFDTAAPRGSSGGSNNGIKNVRSRVSAMCGGDLIITSVPGVGTIVRINIPKEVIV